MIELRPLTAADAEAHCAGEDELTVRWLTGGYGDVEGTITYFESLARNAARGVGKRGFGIWKSDRLCGYIDYTPNLDDGLEPDDVSLAYTIHPWARGQGVAVEAVRLICDLLRTNEIGKRAAIRVEPDNIPSVRVAQKAGFKYVRDYQSNRDTQPDGTPTTFSLYLLDLFRIRDAAPGDGDPLAGLRARSRAAYYRAGGHEVPAIPDERYREIWRNMVADDRLTVLVAVVRDEIVGVITLDANGVFPTNAPHERRVRLVGIFVDPDHWSSGVGTALMERFVSITRQADAMGEVDVWERNSRAIHFYERHGWTRDGTSRPGPADADYIGFTHLP
ncbi:GNAT family N-acetyltransferase [Kribbella sp. WER1]